MRKFVWAVLLVFLFPLSTFAEQSIVGTYKVVSYVVDIDGVPRDALGKAPRGYLIVTPTRWIVLLTAESRKFGQSVEEKAALWDSMNAHAGPYRLDGNKVIVSVDASYNEFWNGTEQTRLWDLQGKRLSITTLPAPYSKDPSKTVVARVVWERIE